MFIFPLGWYFFAYLFSVNSELLKFALAKAKAEGRYVQGRM